VNRIPEETRKTIIRMLCEGCSIRGTSRMTGCEKRTVIRAIVEFGQSCKLFLDDVLHDLTLGHCEIDEMWTFVGKKQARLTVEEKATRSDIGDAYLWTAVDQTTKLIPTFLLGKRSADNARRFMVDLRSRLAGQPKPHESDDHAFEKGSFQRITQISTDGFAGYPEAVDLAFGPYAAHGVLIKEYRNAGMAYDPGEMVGTQRRPISGQITPRSICTSHVERNNLTVRTFMKRFARLTIAFSKKFENLEAACALFVAYYNFVWRTRHSDKSGKPGKLRPTAAMMAKVTDHLWNFDEFYRTVNQYG
jgi:IS1 family transposase